MDDKEICHCLQVSAYLHHKRETDWVRVKSWDICDTLGISPGI